MDAKPNLNAACSNKSKGSRVNFGLAILYGAIILISLCRTFSLGSGGGFRRALSLSGIGTAVLATPLAFFMWFYWVCEARREIRVWTVRIWLLGMNAMAGGLLAWTIYLDAWQARTQNELAWHLARYSPTSMASVQVHCVWIRIDDPEFDSEQLNALDRLVEECGARCMKVDFIRSKVDYPALSKFCSHVLDKKFRLYGNRFEDMGIDALGDRSDQVVYQFVDTSVTEAGVEQVYRKGRSARAERKTRAFVIEEDYDETRD